jgi:simple sugar transport system ATP-binding protein
VTELPSVQLTTGAPAVSPAGSDTGPALRTTAITKRFGGVRALRGVDLDLFHGEVVGLVGDNGAGKSTLVNVIAGVLKPDSGTIAVNGVEQRIDNPADARRHGIETVFQNLSLIPTLDIAENVFLNRELYRAGVLRHLSVMDTRAMRRKVAETFDRLGLRLPGPSTLATHLSGGQRQAVAVARAVMFGGQIMLLDEPSAALGIHQTEIVLSLVERLKDHNVAVVFISHNLPHVLRVADRIVVMRRGRKSLDSPRSSVTAAQLVAHMAGAPPSEVRSA